MTETKSALFEPEATVWGAVSQAELKKYTKKEIHDALCDVADNLRPEGGFER